MSHFFERGKKNNPPYAENKRAVAALHHTSPTKPDEAGCYILVGARDPHTHTPDPRALIFSPFVTCRRQRCSSVRPMCPTDSSEASSQGTVLCHATVIYMGKGLISPQLFQKCQLRPKLIVKFQCRPPLIGKCQFNPATFSKMPIQPNHFCENSNSTQPAAEGKRVFGEAPEYPEGFNMALVEILVHPDVVGNMPGAHHSGSAGQHCRKGLEEALVPVRGTRCALPLARGKGSFPETSSTRPWSIGLRRPNASPQMCVFAAARTLIAFFESAVSPLSVSRALMCEGVMRGFSLTTPANSFPKVVVSPYVLRLWCAAVQVCSACKWTTTSPSWREAVTRYGQLSSESSDPQICVVLVDSHLVLFSVLCCSAACIVSALCRASIVKNVSPVPTIVFCEGGIPPEVWGVWAEVYISGWVELEFSQKWLG
eukprot:TRINITY_DN3087_c0_g1_i3.p1 TRINITY_DN3087_c0_g1~~TRINITY_DN3087_c0_g1_i3.p1  ORF type:complete len:426 (+),score=-49.94 TRINITY_DN3087_c0_g1_i3:135-1412(+)